MLYELTRVSFIVLGKMDVLKYLINEVRVKPLAREKVNGMTTVHAASTANQLPVVKVTCVHAKH